MPRQAPAHTAPRHGTLAGLLLAAIALPCAAAPTATRSPGEVVARAALAQRNKELTACRGGEVAAEAWKPTLAERVATLKARRGGLARGAAPAASPYVGRGLGDHFSGLDGKPATFHGESFTWFLGFALRPRAGDDGEEYRVGVFRDPTGRLHYGAKRLQAHERRPSIPPPCGLKTMSRVPRFRHVPGAAVRIGEFDAAGKLHGFGVEQDGTISYIGFFRHGRRHGWGAIQSRGDYQTEVGKKPVPSYRVKVGQWADGALAHGYDAIHEADLARPIQRRKLPWLPLYVGEVRDSRPHGYGSGVSATWVHRGRFEAGRPVAGRILIDLYTNRKEWIWPGKYRDAARAPKKPYSQLAAGDVILTPDHVVPLAVALAAEGDARRPGDGMLPVFLENGAALWADQPFEVIADAAIVAAARKRLAKLETSPRFASWKAHRADFRLAKFRREVDARKQREAAAAAERRRRIPAQVKRAKARPPPKRYGFTVSAERHQRDLEAYYRSLPRSHPDYIRRYGGGSTPGGGPTYRGSAKTSFQHQYDRMNRQQAQRTREQNRALQERFEAIRKKRY